MITFLIILAWYLSGVAGCIGMFSIKPWGGFSCPSIGEVLGSLMLGVFGPPIVLLFFLIYVIEQRPGWLSKPVCDLWRKHD